MASKLTYVIYVQSHYRDGHEYELAEIDDLPVARTSDLQEVYRLTTRGDNDD
jgi:hypothetical protein